VFLRLRRVLAALGEEVDSGSEFVELSKQMFFTTSYS
jgi:hypothetical protein